VSSTTTSWPRNSRSDCSPAPALPSYCARLALLPPPLAAAAIVWEAASQAREFSVLGVKWASLAARVRSLALGVVTAPAVLARMLSRLKAQGCLHHPLPSQQQRLIVDCFGTYDILRHPSQSAATNTLSMALLESWLTMLSTRSYPSWCGNPRSCGLASSAWAFIRFK
jgi:hypothetical protein